MMARRPRGPWLLAASLRAYQLLLWLYPSAFRRAWGADMAQLFDDLVAQAWRCRGLRGLLATWMATLVDLAASLPREHLARLARPSQRHRAQYQAAFAQLVSSQRAIGPNPGTGRTTTHVRDRFRRLFIRRHPARPQSQETDMQDQGRFDRFTERARKVMRLAQEEAQQFHHSYMGTEHLLLGFVREGEGLGAQVLREIGIELERVRHEVEFIIGHGDRVVTGEIGLTPRAKKVVELAVDEARRMGHHYIGTEHLLLGMVREGEGIAAGVLEKMGVQLERVRAETLRILAENERRKRDGGDWPNTPPSAPPSA